MSFEANARNLAVLCQLYRRNIINRNRFKTPMEMQVRHQISMVCEELNDNFQQLKRDYSALTLTHSGYKSYLDELKKIIDTYPGLNHEKLGTHDILNEIKSMA